ncbi:MAG: MFS transporter, partial [Clostridia bacterium]
TTIPAGGICAYFLGSIVLNFFDYRALFFISGSIGILAGAIWLINMTKMKQYLNAFHNFECNQNSSLPSESALPKQNFIKLIFTTGVVFAVFCVLFNGVLKDGITLWIPTLLTDVFFVSPSRASLISIVLPIVNLLGAFVANYLNKRFFKNELTTVAAMFFVSMLSVIGLYFLGSRSVIAAAVLISICTSAMLGANTMLLTFIPLNFSKIGRSASMTGFLDACSYLASAVASVTIGLITVSHGWSVTILTWAAVALCGLLIAVIGIPVWKKHREP